jgi:hypothetical protein
MGEESQELQYGAWSKRREYVIIGELYFSIVVGNFPTEMVFWSKKLLKTLLRYLISLQHTLSSFHTYLF